MTEYDPEDQPWPILDQQAWLESQNAIPITGAWFDEYAAAERPVVIGAGSPETSALTHCPTCGSPEWLDDGRRGWNPVDVECEVCAGTYTEEEDDSEPGDA